MKMKIFFILLNILAFSSNTNEKENEYHLKFNYLFSKSLDLDVKVYCSKNNSKNFHFKGRPENIENIIKNKKYNLYSAIYINKINNFNITKFPTSTIFFINSDIIDRKMINQYKDYCFVESNSNNNFENYKYYYVSLYSILDERTRRLTIYFIILFSLIIFIFVFIYCCFYNSLQLIKIYLNSLANRNLYLSFTLAFSCLMYQFFSFSALIHSIYKSIIIIDTIYLLNGYNIIYFRQPVRKKIIYTLIVIIIEIIVTLIIIYITNFIPKFDKFYLFFLKTLIEHFIIIGISIKMFIYNFISLYKQYRLERRIRTIVTLAYKYKLIIYTKVIIYSFLYSLGFIIISFMLISSHSKDDKEEYIFYLNIALELFFSIIFAILFFPLRNSLFYYFEVNYDYNSITFVAQIKSNNEKNMKISNLKQKRMKNEYLKHEYPLVLVEPFTKTNNLLNGPNIHVGIVKRI